ncbi:hypothetical protein ACJMK2_029591 [Sinanodonta woodiana]|uniref:CUB domain-containing protein n=2 Tax=Sinanodonta woodiana TaxID=1069815 RepID=A0ABD3XEH4_SINWO
MDNYNTWIARLVFLITFHHIVSGEYSSACFNSTQKSLKLDCGSGYMLRIKGAFYGYSSQGFCSFHPGDCTQLEYQSYYPCVGQSSCSINLPSGSYGQHLQSCDKDSTYFQVEYTCVPVFQTADICATPMLNAQSGYISTPRYPSNYRDNADCSTKITVDPHQKINLTIIDMDLESNGTYSCMDWLYALDGLRSVTLCARRANEGVAILQSNEITIQFKSDSSGNRKGFWLYFDAYPPMPPTTTSTTTARHTTGKEEPVTTPPSKPKDDTIPITMNAQQSQKKEEEKLPFAAIVGGVIGTLAFILIVLLTLLGLKWWKERRSYSRSKNTEYIDARNPAFRSSNDFQGVEIYCNC